MLLLPMEVLITIFEYLPYEDLLQIRLVCKKWNNLIISTKLKTNTKLCISKRNVIDFLEYLKTQSDILSISYVELEKFEWNITDLEFIMERIGPHIRSIVLPSELIYPTLYKHLLNVEKLYLNITKTCQWVESFGYPLNLAMLTKLNTLELKCDHSYLRFLITRYLKMLDNIKYLQLQHISLCFVNKHVEEVLLSILQTHAATLKYIELTFTETVTRMGIPKWCEVFKQFEKLKTIRIGGKRSFDWLYAVFNSLPSKAPIAHIDLGGLVYVNGILLTIILEKWSKKLQNLDVMFCPTLVEGNLDLLKTTTNNLLVLNLSNCDNITSKALLGAIEEENKTLREIYLTALTKLDEECICTLTKRLPNIEVLYLDNSGEVTDKVLAYIFHFQKDLKCLVLDDSKYITDDGLLPSKEFNDSIQSLQRLQKLSLRNCRNLSNRGLNALKFKDLRCLELCYCIRVSDVGIKNLVLNCPTIQTLSISSCPKLNDKSISFVCQYLQNLQYLNISNCENLTESCIDYIVTYCSSLKWLIMLDLISWNFNNVQEKLKFNRKLEVVNAHMY